MEELAMSPRYAILAGVLWSLSAGCAAMPEAAAPATMAAEPAAPALTRSLYAKDASGALTEDDLQKILESPIDLQFPARVGVVPLARPFAPEEPVEIQTRSVAAQSLARALIGHPHFSHVSDISTDLPNVGGLEGLRVLAARYRLRYLILYSEQFEDDTHLNGWAWLYPTIIGMFAAPGLTVESHGLAQAHLVDVRTGTVLFSVIEPMEVSEPEWMIGAERAHRQAQAEAAAAAARRLAKRVAQQTNALVAFADRAKKERIVTRMLPAPIAAETITADTAPLEVGAATGSTTAGPAAQVQ
jgi:rhombotail lipoprotein